MIEEYGIVKHRDQKKVVINLTVPGKCEKCPVKENCYQRGNLLTIPAKRLEGVSPSELEPDMEVKLQIKRISLLGFTSLLYGLPLLAFLLGLLLGYYLFFPNFTEQLRPVFSFLTGSLLLTCAAFFLRFLDKRNYAGLEYRIARL